MSIVLYSFTGVIACAAAAVFAAGVWAESHPAPDQP
jgi:3-deoxy-D-manno-octulosonic acid (KDO) 8-phosphate synthase